MGRVVIADVIDLEAILFNLIREILPHKFAILLRLGPLHCYTRDLSNLFCQLKDVL